MLMIKVIEKSMIHEYEKNIAPRHLAEMVGLMDHIIVRVYKIGASLADVCQLNLSNFL